MQLNRFQMAAVKRTAQNTKRLVSQRDKVNAKMQELAGQLIGIQSQIDNWETPIKTMTGGFTSEQILEMNGLIPENNIEEPSSEENYEGMAIQAEVSSGYES